MEMHLSLLWLHGPNSSMPHATPTNKKIEFGDVVLIDMGCRYQGYCSDMTRTIFMDEISEEMKKAYNAVLENQDLMFRHIGDGENITVTCKTIEANLEKEGYGLIHAMGHGVGLESHEKPFLSTKKDIILKENMIITNEPGVYMPGEFGIRIEDTVLVGKIRQHRPNQIHKRHYSYMKRTVENGKFM